MKKNNWMMPVALLGVGALAYFLLKKKEKTPEQNMPGPISIPPYPSSNLLPASQPFDWTGLFNVATSIYDQASTPKGSDLYAGSGTEQPFPVNYNSIDPESLYYT